MGQRLEAGRGSGDVVAVAHPHREGGGQAVEQGAVGAVQVERGRAVLSRIGSADAAAELVHHRLHTVADAQHGQAAVVHPAGGERRALLVDAGRAAGEDDAPGVEALNVLPGGVVRHYLAEHPAFAHPPRDEAAVLRPEVDYQHRLAR